MVYVRANTQIHGRAGFEKKRPIDHRAGCNLKRTASEAGRLTSRPNRRMATGLVLLKERSLQTTTTIAFSNDRNCCV